jgi:nucleoid-associated protein YgaU
MGKLEKVIVLSVLFVIAVILVVSLTTDDPLDKQNATVLGAPPAKVAGGTPATTTPPVASNTAAQPAASGGAQPAALLSTNVTPDAAPASTPPASPAPAAVVPASAPVANAKPAGSILVTLDGLTDSYLPDMKFYTWQENDTFRGIANTYYGDWTRLTLLRRANEGRKNVQPGEKILVPVFDLDAPIGAAPVASGTGAQKSGPPAADANAKKNTKSAKPSAPVASGGGKIHVVKEGESLWKIAKAELGNGAHWEKIYQANKDVMKSPEALKTGMKLKIP